MSSTLKIATCQFAVSESVPQNAVAIRRFLHKAAQAGADVVHFSECALSGYVGTDFPSFDGYDWSVLRQETLRIMALAAELGLWVVLGSMHRLSGDHKPHNCVYVISSEGRIIVRYDKRFCTRADLRYYSPGDHFVTFEVNGVKCGVLVCYDLGFPELYRQYCRLGTQVMFHSFYNARNPRHHRERAEVSPLLGRAHAVLNHMYVSLCNTSGPLSWPSCFVAADGTLTGQLEAERPGVLIRVADTRAEGYDSTRQFRLQAIEGKLNTGTPVDDERSRDRTCY